MLHDNNWSHIQDLWENYLVHANVDIKISTIKQLAAEYLDTDLHKKLSRHEIRAILAKTEKIKVSYKKEERNKGHQLAKELQSIFNFHK
jgi:hypothetical protein